MADWERLADEFAITCVLGYLGGAALDLNAVEPKPRQWIQDMTWLNLVELSRLPTFANILKDIPRKEKVTCCNNISHSANCIFPTFVVSFWLMLTP